MIEKGVVTHVGEVQQINDKMEKLLFVIEKQDGQYSKSIAFELINNSISQMDGIGVGQVVEVKADISSREYNGRWYTQAKAWSVKAEPVSPPVSSGRSNITRQEDDLPF